MDSSELSLPIRIARNVLDSMISVGVSQERIVRDVAMEIHKLKGQGGAVHARGHRFLVEETAHGYFLTGAEVVK